MNRKSLLVLFLAFSILPAAAQQLGMGTGRSHSELHWMERRTEHFILIYPEHLEDVAREAAIVAENAYGPVMAGMELEKLPRPVSIVLSDEDQIVNGFALPGKMFVWVNVNDYARWVSGAEPWLRTVISHEFQHDVWFEAGSDWTGFWGLLGTPGWAVEGMAEYETEKWGTFRSDMRVREKILMNRHQDLDPHNSGFTRLRYMAETYGDSVITRAVHKRKWLGLADFKGGFKEAAGISLGEFEEEWRRAATAYTYATFSQKEAVDEVGKAMKRPLRFVSAIDFSADSTKVAVLGRISKDSDTGLYVIATDSTARRREIDHGRIDMDFAFSSDASRLVYAKLHRGAHGGLIWDLKVADLNRGKTRWITHNRRASHPTWSPAADEIVFTAVDGRVTNLYRSDPEGDELRALTDFVEPETRIFDPAISPDGGRVVCSLYKPGRSMDLWLLDRNRDETRFLTTNPAYDMLPIWGPEGRHIFFSSDRYDRVPNVFTLDASLGEASVHCMSDVGEALGAYALVPGGGLAALAMSSTDTLRLRELPLDRRVEPSHPAIRERYVSWMDRIPPYPVPEPDYAADPAWSEARPYRSWRHLRHLASLVLPSFDLKGIWGVTVWMDAAHRQRWVLGADAGLRDEQFTLRAAYLGWSGLTGPGTLNLSLWKDARESFRLYGDDLLRDRRSGGRLRWEFPMNFGEHLYANHKLSLGFTSETVEVQGYSDLDLDRIGELGLPEPVESYVDAGLEVRWDYVKARPAKAVFGHPQGGQALSFSYRYAAEALGGDYDYQRLDLNAGRVQSLPLGALTARLRGEWLGGEAPSQDFTGLHRDGVLLTVPPGLLDDFFHFPEPMSMRGLRKSLAGDRATLLTLEWSLPLLPPLPISAFGFSPGGLTALGWLDLGGVWDQNGGGTRRFGGWEARLPLRIGGQEIVFPSIGQAWNLEDGSADPVNYFRLAAVWNGF